MTNAALVSQTFQRIKKNKFDLDEFIEDLLIYRDIISAEKEESVPHETVMKNVFG